MSSTNPYTCYFLAWILMLMFHISYAQQSRESEEKIIADLMERWIENTESTIDYNDLQDQLEFYLRNKLDLNKASREELQRLAILDEVAIDAIISHRSRYGPFMSIYELQTIEEIDARMLYYLSYFVAVDEDRYAGSLSLSQLLSKGKHEVVLFHENNFQQRAGYEAGRAAAGKSYYLGSPYRYVARYRFSHTNRLSFGYTGEKDMGEPFFEGAQQQGFDFNSVHFVWRGNGHIKTIALGDYQANFGQGLTFASGLAVRKSAYVLNVRRSDQVIRPYRSVNENEFLRGAAITYQLKPFEVTGIFSLHEISTNYRASDSLETNEEVFSSIQLTGLHRTATEIMNRDNVLQGIYGGHITWKGEDHHIGLTAVHTFYDKSFQPGSKPYQLYNFSGTQLSNIGTDYHFYAGNVSFFGEISRSSNGAFAGITGMMVPLHQQLDLVMVYRNYAKNYQSSFNNPFGENSDGRNEEGYYTGLVFKPAYQWVLSAYFDMYRSPWFRYLADGPSHGYDWLGECQYNPSKMTQLYARYRHETKTKNLPGSDAPVDYLSAQSRDVIRLNAQYKISAAFTGKSRAEFVQYHDELNGYKSGTLIFQDLIYATPFKDLSITARVALFSVDDYAARIYATENDVLYQYAVPQYQDSGTRYYLLLHYRLSRQLDLWVKYSQTTYNQVSTISSGLDQVNGNVLSDLRVQVRWSF